MECSAFNTNHGTADKKVTKENLYGFVNKRPLLNDPCWAPFDNMMCRLANQLCMVGCSNTLEVKFQVKSGAGQGGAS
jgi:hypothetical protein